MFFSVIVPVHNAEKYIRELLASILPQIERFNGEAELLLIENASDDDSKDICDEYAAKNPFVFCWHYGKIGAYAARREGIKKAAGEWLVFADADDILVGDALEKIKNCICSYSTQNEKKTEKTIEQDMNGCTQIYEADRDTCQLDIVLYNAATAPNPSKKKFDFPFEDGRIYEGSEKDIFYRVMCENDSLNAMWNKCIKREFAEKVLLDNNDIRLNYGEDLLQTASFLDKAEGIVYLDEILYMYRPNESGLTGGYHAEYLPNQEIAWNKFDSYVKKWGGEKFASIVDKRKSLTCSIAISKLIYSHQPLKVKKAELKNIINSDFYKKYSILPLPDWAPDESRFVHGLQMSKNPYTRLLLTGAKYDVKVALKKILK